MKIRRWPKSDLGTVLLHWSAIAPLVLLIGTGLRIASDDAAMAWLLKFDVYLPREHLWLTHVSAGYLFTGLSVAYGVYVGAMRLASRTRVSTATFSGIFVNSKSFWMSVNRIAYFIFFVSTCTEIISGWLLLYEITTVHEIHLLVSWVLIAFPFAHVLVQLQIGGVPQIARIFRPSTAIEAPQVPDLAEVVADLLAERAGQARSVQAIDEPVPLHADGRARTS
jgi:hypothetical protein